MIYPNNQISVSQGIPTHVLDWSLKDLLAQGRYRFVDVDLTDDLFPTNVVKGGGYVGDFVLVQFNLSQVPTADVVPNINNLGLEPAVVAETLSFGIQHPHLQLEFNIVGLGSWASFSPGGLKFSPALVYKKGAGFRKRGERQVELMPQDCEPSEGNWWRGETRFLARRIT